MTRQRRAATAATILLAAAALSGCGGSGDTPGVASAQNVSTGGGASPSGGQSANAFADCMVAAGVVMYKTDEGVWAVDKDRTSAAKSLAGYKKCARYQVVSTGSPTHVSQQDLEARRRYAACIRQHGVPAFPDPDPQTGETNLESLGGTLKADPKFQGALEACRNTLPSPTGASVAGG